MNQTFNLKRFSLLFTKHTAEHYKTYLLSFFVLLGVLFLTMGFAAYISGGKLSISIQIPFFIFVLLIAGTIFTSIIFSDLSSKKRAISALILPASHLEKFLIAWTYSFVIFQVLFIPAFYLVVMIINQLAFSKPGEPDPKLLDLFSKDQGVFIVFLFYAILHAIELWGAIFFEKYHFIKTGFAFFIGIFTLSLLNTEFMKALFNTRYITSAVPFSQVNIVNENHDFQRVIVPMENNQLFIIIILIVVVILWVCSFYRLKEKEV